MADTRVTFDIIARDRASSTFKKVGRQAETTGDKLQRSLRGVASTAAVAARGIGIAGGAVATGLGVAIAKASTFDKTMRTVAVATKAPQAALKQLNDLALKMGKDTVFSAQDAGNAMLELAKGGMTAATIQAGALQETLTLAAAGGTDLASAANFMTRGMKTFRLSATQARRVTTALAGGATKSTASIEDLGQALAQVGPGAKNAGLSIEETVAALAAFADSGIRGSDAGTSLKTMLSRLIPTTIRAVNAMDMYNLKFVDAQGHFKSLTEIAGLLQRNLGNLTEAERAHTLQVIFGSDAQRAATVLMNEGAAGIERYIAATKDVKNAQELANVAMGGASGAWENFKGALETVTIQIGQRFLPAATRLLSWAADALPKAFAAADQAVARLRERFAGAGDYVREQLIPMMQRVAQDVLPALRYAVARLSESLRDLRASFGSSGDSGEDFRSIMDLIPPIMKLVAFEVRVVATNVRILAAVFRSATAPLRAFIDLAQRAIALAEKVKAAVPGTSGLSKGFDIRKVIPGFADGGTVTRSGMAWVGERGPELVRLPAGATVYDAQQSAAATAGGVNVTQHIVTADPQRAADESVRGVRRAAWAAGWAVA